MNCWRVNLHFGDLRILLIALLRHQQLHSMTAISVVGRKFKAVQATCHHAEQLTAGPSFDPLLIALLYPKHCCIRGKSGPNLFMFTDG